MVFSSLYEFEKWHKSIQYRFNHASSAGRKPQTGADIPPFTRSTTGPRQPQPMAQRVSNPLQRNGLDALRPSEPTPYPPVRYEWEEWD